MAYKRELIVNNGSLTSYKKLLKVSDVCQLLDKSQYPTVITKAGVTTTSNGDGSITINGTATASDYINCTPEYSLFNNGHVFYVCANNTSMNRSTWFYSLLNQGIDDMGSGVISKTDATRWRYTGIFFYSGVVFDNVVIRPQILDLTEMYGAGNEPATVAEFKAKFPNEMYDYSPRCWVTSYKTGLIAKTKNLFDYKTPEYVNATLIETLSNGAILKGKLSDDSGNASYANGWFRPGDANDSKNKRVELKTGDIVTISADYTLLEQYSSESNFCSIYLYCYIDSLSLTFDASTVKLPLNKTVRISQTYTIKGDADYYPVFTLNSSKVKITNIQIEKGSTATDYVPYGYL